MKVYVGLVVKVLFNQIKHYAVVAAVDGENVTIRTTSHKDGQVVVVEKTTPITNTRPVTTWSQDHLSFELLRQMVGVKVEDTKPIKAGKPIGQPMGGGKPLDTTEFD